MTTHAISADGITVVEPTRYLVTQIPLSHENSAIWSLELAWRGPESWAVMWNSRCLNADNEWDYEPLPSERSDQWIADHRFTFDEARERAIAALPQLRINGMTSADVLALMAKRGEL